MSWLHDTRSPILFRSERWGKERENFSIQCPHCGTPQFTAGIEVEKGMSTAKQVARYKLESYTEYSVCCSGCEIILLAKDLVVEELQ